MFMRPEDIHTFQMDHNSTCNLRCPQCARVAKGKINPQVPQKYLSLEFYEKVFSKSLCQSIERVFFCGNYGDVIASPNILEVCEYLKSQGLKKIQIVTNGSLRDVEWWKDLASILSDPSDKVLFSIDGLQDTNHLYRVGSRFEKIMENATAFISSGGKARWEYLVFSHNEHQVEEAQNLARSMGFAEFKIKKTNRFISDKNYKSGKKDTEDSVHDTRKKETYKIEVPKNKNMQTKSLSQFEKIVKKYSSWEGYINKAQITCKAQKERSLFIDFEGDLWPCTWVAAPPYFYGDQNTQKKQLSQVISHYGSGFNNLYTHSMEEVLRHPWFANQLEASWCGNTKDNVPKLMTCGRTCGQEYEFSSNAPENKEIVELA